MAIFHYGRPVVLTGVLVALLGSVPACVSTSDYDHLRSQVYYQDQERKKLEERITALESDISRSKPTQANNWAEMDSMRAQLAALNGKFDDVRRNQEAQRSSAGGASIESLSAQVADLQRKNQAMASQLGVTFEEGPTTAQAPSTQQGQPAMQPAATSAPTMPTPVPYTGPSTKPQAAGPAPAPAATHAAEASGEELPKAGPGQDLYQQALESFYAKKYKQAQGTWGEFVKGFPKDPLVPNALFWEGECFFQLQDYANAVLVYQKVIEEHSKSNKLRAAQLKQGISFYKLKKEQAGKLVLEDLIKKAPDSAEAKRAQAFLKSPN